MEDGVIDISIQQRNERIRYRRAARQLRDNSDPFNLPDAIIRQIHRLPKDIAREIFLEILPELDNGIRRTRIPPVVEFFATLHFFGFGSYQKFVGRDVLGRLSQPAVSRSLHHVAPAIITRLHGYIRFPQTLREITVVKTAFYEKFGLPGVIGAIDCSHIAIVPPPMGHPQPRIVYLNRKQFFSINTQLVCDANLRILGLNARFPGSVHDAAIWAASDVCRQLKQKYQAGERNCWLLGDVWYPLRPYLLTAVNGAPPGTPAARYTAAHLSARNSIERCIGVLKGRFRCLSKDRVLHYSPNFAPTIIYACGILHNILIAANIGEDDVELAPPDSDDEEDGDNSDDDDGDNLAAGDATRNYVIDTHFAV